MYCNTLSSAISLSSVAISTASWSSVSSSVFFSLYSRASFKSWNQNRKKYSDGTDLTWWSSFYWMKCNVQITVSLGWYSFKLLALFCQVSTTFNNPISWIPSTTRTETQGWGASLTDAMLSPFNDITLFDTKSYKLKCPLHKYRPQ